VSALFITGSGTDIGKNFVTAALIQTLRRRGRQVEALKPVVTGFDPAQSALSDPGILLAALGEPVTPAALDRIAPWRYAAPLAPDMAAKRAGQALDVAALIASTRRAVDAARDVLLIEGVGGVMVPLDDKHTVLDWMAALSLPVLLVGGSYLGAISHALTALDALRHRHLTVKAIIIDETPGSGVDLAETVATITRFAEPVPVLALPRLASAEADHPALQSLADLL
jgi:dethiobiotin synthetase